MKSEPNKGYSFGDFEIDVDRRRLSKNGEAVNVNPKAFNLLLTLVENHGKTLTKNDLLDRVWENQFVEENNLTVHVAALRRALGETKGDHRYIVTVPGKGYRFVSEVEELHTSEIVVESREFQRIIVDEEETAETAAQTTTPAIAPGVTDWRRWAAVFSAVPILLLVSGLTYWLYTTQTGPAAPFRQSTATRLTSSGRVNSAMISSDGNYFVYAQADDKGQSLWVRQVSESRNIQLMPAEAVEYWGLSFSPDNTQVYATIFTAKQADPVLIRLPVLGGAVEELKNVSCSAVSFSPDGKRFAYVVSSSGAGGTLLRTANADGSDDKFITILKDPSYFVFPGATVAWPPDGQTIAVATKIVDESGDYGAVMKINVADGNMAAVKMRRFPRIETVLWTPKGDGLILTANGDASSPTQIWYQGIDGGDAVRLSSDSNSYSSVAAANSGDELVAVQQTINSAIWSADYDTEMGTPTQIASETLDHGELGWTTDGNIIFRSRASGKLNLWSMAADGSDVKQITTDSLPDKGVSVSPDNRFILFSSYRGGKYNIWRVDRDGGNLTQLTHGSGEAYPRITPAGRHFFYQSGIGEVTGTIWTMPIDGGEAQQVTKTHSVYPSLSPDGTRISYFYMDTSKSGVGEWRIAIASTSDGAVLQSFKIPDNIIGRVARWSPDGRSIVYATSNGNVGNLWKQSLDGSVPVQITNFASYTIGDFAWSPDGKKIALTRSNEIRDVVLIEGVQ